MIKKHKTKHKKSNEHATSSCIVRISGYYESLVLGMLEWSDGNSNLLVNKCVPFSVIVNDILVYPIYIR